MSLASADRLSTGTAGLFLNIPLLKEKCRIAHSMQILL
jgi:hypothetical protein